MRRVSLFLAVWVGWVLGCSRSPEVVVSTVVRQEMDLSGVTHLKIEAVGVPVEVLPGRPGKLEVRMKVRGTGPDRAVVLAKLKTLGVDLAREGETARMAARPEARGGSAVSPNYVKLDVKVPPGISLNVLNRDGAIDLESVNGTIVAHTTNASIRLMNVAGDLDVSTNGGPIQVNAVEAGVRIKADNASVVFSGRLKPGRHRIETTNSPIRVFLLPQPKTLSLDARTSGWGQVQSRLPLTNPMGPGTSDLTHVVGAIGTNPDTRLELETTRSEIDISSN